MTKKTIYTPITVEINQIKRRMFDISFEEDGSIYLFFPRKLGYIATCETDIKIPIIGERKITMLKNRFTKGSPYISFHPKKMSIHINTQIYRERYKADMPVLNLGLNAICFPLCQIFIPTFSYFDIYLKKKKHGPPLNLISKVSNPIISLNINVWVHPKDKMFNFEEIPSKDVYKNKLKLVAIITFKHSTNNPYTCTLIIAEVEESKIKDNVKPEIIVSVFNDNQPYVFGLSPL